MSTWSSRSAKRNPRARKSHTIRIPKPRITKASGAWGAFTALFGLLAFTVQSVTLIVLALVSLAGLIVTSFAGNRVAVPPRRASTERRKSPGNTRSRRPATKKPGAPTKRRRCSIACRTSTKDAKTCDCSCGGKSHGSEVSREFLKSRPAKKQERQVVRSQRGAK